MRRAVAELAAPPIQLPALPHPRPFLRWAGGKAQILESILGRIPESAGSYFEPFLGGGAVFFGLRAQGRPERAVLSDLSAPLALTYRGVRDHLDEVVERLEALFRTHDEAQYYRVRAERPNAFDVPAMAVWLLYINRTCFNGLYRENSRGDCNTPSGKRVAPTVDLENLRACARALECVEVHAADFRMVLPEARAGDVAYLDPPYLPRSGTASFTSYTRGGFSPTDQTALRDMALALIARGVRVVISNHDCPQTRALYPRRRFKFHTVPARRAIAARGASRVPVDEVVIVGRP